MELKYMLLPRNSQVISLRIQPMLSCIKLVCSTALLGLIVCLVGCGKSSNQIDVFPVQGKVLHKGEPASGATVVFYPSAPLNTQKPLLPQGIANEEGIFKLRSYEDNDGAPAGEYKVTVTWPDEVPEGHNAEMYGPKDRLKGRYSKPEESGLKVTVSEGENVLEPFELN